MGVVGLVGVGVGLGGVGLGWNDSQISNFQTELRYLGLLKFYYVPTDLGVPPWGWLGGVGIVVGVGWWGSLHKHKIFKQNCYILIC